MNRTQIVLLSASVALGGGIAAAQTATAVTLDEVVAEKAFADCLERQAAFLGDDEVSFGSLILDKEFVAGMVCGAPEKVSPHLSQELREGLAAQRELCRVDVTTCEGYVAGEVAGDE